MKKPEQPITPMFPDGGDLPLWSGSPLIVSDSLFAPAAVRTEELQQLPLENTHMKLWVKFPLGNRFKILAAIRDALHPNIDLLQDRGEEDKESRGDGYIAYTYTLHINDIQKQKIDRTLAEVVITNSPLNDPDDMKWQWEE